MIDVSIIIPAFNSEKTLPATIQSVLTQKTKKSFEVIVVDDNSTDKTFDVAKTFTGINVLKNEKKGPAYARNYGAKNAKGDILLFIDSDCVASRSWLNEMIKPFKNNKVAGVQGAYKSMQSELSARFSQIEIEDRYDLMLESRKNLDWIGSYSAGYMKKDFFEAKGFDESFPTASGEDPALSFKINSMGKKIVFNMNAVVYHMHPRSFIDYFKKKFFRAFYRVHLYKKFPKKAIKDSYTPQIMKIRIGLIGMLICTLIAGTEFNLFNFFSLLLVLLILLSTAPFSVKAFEKDKEIGLMSPFILITRDSVFLLGLALGTMRSLVKK